MENALMKVGEEKFGKGKFYIDKVQNDVFDHLHWHARPAESTDLDQLLPNDEMWHSDPADITSWRKPYIKLQ